jgi:hypothetical protein
VKSFANERFWKAFAALPKSVQRQARKAYRRFKSNPHHPSLQFKRVHTVKPVYAVRINRHYRALGVREGDIVVWFWVGTHATYDKILG